MATQGPGGAADHAPAEAVDRAPAEAPAELPAAQAAAAAQLVAAELPAAQLPALLTPLFEDAPRFIGRLVAGGPYGSWEALLEEAERIALAMPEAERIELIDAHPHIGAPPGSVSALSFVEQGYDQDRAEASAEAERGRVQEDLDRLNAAYEARFGFRFVVYVAGRPRSAIVPLMESALDADRDREMERALQDVLAIARDRARKAGLLDA